MAEPVKILIVEDHALVRKGLLALLAVKPDIKVVGEAVDGVEAVRLAGLCSPDIILMDLEMPRKDGIAAIKEIRQNQPTSKILVLTSYNDDERVISAIQAGANGYLLKTTMPEDLLRSIQEVCQGQLPLDPAVTGTIIREIERPLESPRTGPDDLSNREIDVIKLIAQGYSNQRIANDLLISDRTVSTHVSRILNKLELENRTQAALYALRHGLVELSSTE